MDSEIDPPDASAASAASDAPAASDADGSRALDRPRAGEGDARQGDPAEHRDPLDAVDRDELALFRLVAEQSRGIAFRFRVAPSLAFEFVSESAATVAGRGAAEIVADPDAALALVHPQDRAIVRSVLGGAPPPTSPFTIRLMRDDGQLVWLEVRVAPSAGPDGTTSLVGVALDVSDRHAAEAAAQESEERYRTLFDEFTEPAFVIGPDGRILEANGLACTMLGYERPALLALRARDVFPDDEVVRDPLRIGTLAPREIRTAERQVRHRDGHLIDVQAKLRRLPDGRVLGTARDIGDRLRAEAALLESERRFRALFEQLPLPAFTMSLDGHLTGWNPAATTVFGWDAGDVVGQRNPILPEDSAESLLAELAQVAAVPRPSAPELHTRRRDGTELDVVIWASLIRGADAHAVELMAICEDVTARRTAASAIHQSEERFRSLLNASPATIIVADRQGRIVLANPRVRDSFGYEVDELIGKDLELLVPEQFRTGHDERTASYFARPVDRPLGHGRHLVARHRDGHTFPAEISLTPVRGAGDDVDVMATIVDITRREQLESQLRQVQKFESIGQLSGGIAHDFNNLLTAIDGYAELMEGELTAPDDLRADLGHIRAATERAKRLTQQLLAFGRRQVLQPEVVDLDRVVEEMAPMLRLLVGERVELDLRLAPDLGKVRVDRSQIEQVILNLSVNARDAMPDGGRLLLETANVDLDEITAAHHLSSFPGPHVMLAVTDTGVGMDQDVQAHLFEPFYTTKGQSQGTGLGLATVFGIVRQSGGSIWVYSEPGHGSSFRIHFPRLDLPGEVDLGTEEPAPAVAGTGTILLVEDDDGVRGFAVAALERRGYRVLEAPDPEAAIRIVDSRPGTIDLLVTDVIMPGSTGPELARRLLVRWPGLRVLFVSGYTREGAMPDVGLGEHQAFLAKPFSVLALDREIRRLLGG